MGPGPWRGFTAVIETVATTGAYQAVKDRGQLAVGVTNVTDFLRPQRVGRREVVAEPIQPGRTQQLWQVVITRAEGGKAVARGQVRLQNLDAPPALTGLVGRRVHRHAPTPCWRQRTGTITRTDPTASLLVVLDPEEGPVVSGWGSVVIGRASTCVSGRMTTVGIMAHWRVDEDRHMDLGAAGWTYQAWKSRTTS
jgi:hypothetical protein